MLTTIQHQHQQIRMDIHICTFDDLSKPQLYAILRLRQTVFIDEQQSIYEDIDNLDMQAVHLLAEDEGELAGYVRIRLLDRSPVAKIERVVVAPAYRSHKLGGKMMDAAMAWLTQHGDVREVRLSAQLTVLGFYQRWGFVADGEAYDDGGILHRDMAVRL